MEAAMVEMLASEPRERLLAFVEEMVRPLPHVRQRENALVYVRGLVEQGGRKSLQPTLFRLGESPARYESVQQFLADSPWDPTLLVRACAERVAPEIGVLAWIVDDTGIVKDGEHSPGVKRQWSGTLGKIGNCQVTVSVHTVGQRGTLPLGWRLYLPEEWCRDELRRVRAKIPAAVDFETKPALARGLVEQAANWQIPLAPILADQAYGDDTDFRTRLHGLELEYVLSVGVQTSVYPPGTSFAVPERNGTSGRPRTVARADREPESVGALAKRLPARAWKTLPCRTTPAGEDVTSRFAFVRVVAAHPVRRDHRPPREEWLIIEWPAGEKAPSDYWLSNLPASTLRERLARLARLRWTIELDYRQLKGELGLDHYEGRSYLGFHHHCALVTCAHAFLTLERLHPKARRPD
ncbi:MAG: IS701 family transposase [Thermoleophilia bacterium]|nr:IS701 family transposase [Thermoleophilia bacterium]MDH5333230.1 IS701 family transposase [Thermoleophilia bacterium]